MANGALMQAAGVEDMARIASDFDMSKAAGPMVEAKTYAPSDNALVSKQLGSLLSKDSDYMARARTRAAQSSQARGLRNSSIAASAGEAAAIDAALPIAQADATAYFTADRDNAAAANQFGLAANQFGRDGALAKYQGALSMAAKAADVTQDNKRMELDRLRLDTETGLQREDLAFRRDSAGRELSLKERELALGDTFRRDQLAAQVGQQEADRILERERVAIEREKAGQAGDQLQLERDRLAQQARSSLAGDIAQIRNTATQARLELERDPNMSAEAKARAIEALGAKASADIAEMVRFSGISLPDAWPDWINSLGGASPPSGNEAAPAPSSPPPGGGGTGGGSYFDPNGGY